MTKGTKLNSLFGTSEVDSRDFDHSLRVGIDLCVGIRDAVVSILKQEKIKPAWPDSRERFAVVYKQEEDLNRLLEANLSLENFMSDALPHQVKLALADLQTHKEWPIGALYRLLAETVQIAGPAQVE